MPNYDTILRFSANYLQHAYAGNSLEKQIGYDTTDPAGLWGILSLQMETKMLFNFPVLVPDKRPAPVNLATPLPDISRHALAPLEATLCGPLQSDVITVGSRSFGDWASPFQLLRSINLFPSRWWRQWPCKNKRLLLFGIPRMWRAPDIRISLEQAMGVTFRAFLIVFGDPNSPDVLNPLFYDTSQVSESSPNLAIGAVECECEDDARHVWCMCQSGCVRIDGYAIGAVPDPSGYRAYAEAVAANFRSEDWDNVKRKEKCPCCCTDATALEHGEKPARDIVEEDIIPKVISESQSNRGKPSFLFLPYVTKQDHEEFFLELPAVKQNRMSARWNDEAHGVELSFKCEGDRDCVVMPQKYSFVGYGKSAPICAGSLRFGNKLTMCIFSPQILPLPPLTDKSLMESMGSRAASHSEIDSPVGRGFVPSSKKRARESFVRHSYGLKKPLLEKPLGSASFVKPHDEVSATENSRKRLSNGGELIARSVLTDARNAAFPEKISEQRRQSVSTGVVRDGTPKSLSRGRDQSSTNAASMLDSLLERRTAPKTFDLTPQQREQIANATASNRTLRPVDGPLQTAQVRPQTSRQLRQPQAQVRLRQAPRTQSTPDDVRETPAPPAGARAFSAKHSHAAGVAVAAATSGVDQQSTPRQNGNIPQKAISNESAPVTLAPKRPGRKPKAPGRPKRGRRPQGPANAGSSEIHEISEVPKKV